MEAASEKSASNIETNWSEISRGVSDVYVHPAMTSQRFMQLYTCIYNCFSHDNSRNGAGQELHHRIRDLIKTYLIDLIKNAKDKMGEDLIRFYLHEWARFTFSSKVLNGFCLYLNRHWISRECENVYQTYRLALDIWQETVFEPLHGPVIAIILQLISMERRGATVSTSDIKGITDSLVELGNDNNVQTSDQNKNCNEKLGPYQRRFEDPFITETVTFFARESVFLQSERSVSEYMEKADQWLNEERRRVNLCLHNSSMVKLMKCCEQVLIEKSSLHEELPMLLRAHRVEDIGRLYDLVSKLGNSFGSMREILQVHISKEGSAAITQNRELYINNPKEYIKTILDVYQKFSDLVNIAFKREPGFVAALDLACSSFINTNDATSDPSNSHKTPEMLARYCDMLLRKSAKIYDDNELEEMLNQTENSTQGGK